MTDSVRKLKDEIERLEDQYQEVAQALGSRTFFHEDVVERARELRKFWERG
ncbi:hypothetical protein [Afipia felis]|uniref:Uncharacterized protein n=2 Tax=Afipia felis TaxID=1035 RepID=A0A380WCF0_AFIFE|nr:hypothetical protein [Afipia felis]EKS29280.1 hypothetical protein HMPREF9697_01808 [Afipia felis ATCC 53690]SUU77988.1 Uncharacterised protein [Afipia felis]SUU86053.1 Uncharacterised protein [Afipia felis]